MKNDVTTPAPTAVVQIRRCIPENLKPAVPDAGRAIAGSIPDFPSQFRGFLAALRVVFDQRMALGQTVGDIFDALDAHVHEGAR